MLHKFEFFARGIPQAQPRPRATGRLLSRGKRLGLKVWVYDSDKAEAWKQAVAAQAKTTPGFPRQPIQEPVSIEFMFVMPTRGEVPADRQVTPPHVIRPDLDNLEKAVIDALTKARLWKDDAQVWSKISRKVCDKPGWNGCTGVYCTVLWGRGTESG